VVQVVLLVTDDQVGVGFAGVWIMAENLNLPLINILTSVDADVLRQIFTDITKQVNEMNDELKRLKQG
jgi:hypothetical protein